ncbi:MAG: hypothetical protein UR37_C0012G0004 [Microgenomates group bacterium GW2011_GWC1_33_28]|nr:MAG: hypothetical protein UR37_C0012G0004 [Microgenomates group bacterium GW2011_GWC1_33_28]
MPKLPQISGWKIVKLLQKEGWILVSQKGSHVKLSKDLGLGKTLVIVPQHKVLKKGTFKFVFLQNISFSNCNYIRFNLFY